MESRLSTKLLPAILVLLTACSATDPGVDPNAQTPAESPEAPGEVPAAEPSHEPEIPNVEEAKGWDKVEMIGVNHLNTKLTVNNFGYFNISWNSCARNSADGSVNSVAIWNSVTKNLNAAILLPPLKKEDMKCMVAPPERENPSLGGLPLIMDGEVQVQLANREKRLIFNSGGYNMDGKMEICTTIPDEKIAKELMTSLNEVAVIAGKEGCRIVTPSPSPSPSP